MAKNWKIKEAIEALNAGIKEDVIDIGRRFPLFLSLAVRTNEAGQELLSCVPDYISVRKMESVLKSGITETDGEDVAEDDEEEIEDKAPNKKDAKAGKEKETKGKGKAKKEEAPEEEDEDEDEGEDLKSKSAKELFEMCKAAGIKVKPKQDKKVYIKALEEANEAEDNEADDWDEEEEAPKETKGKGKAKKDDKPAKGKGKGKAKDEEEDGDDWDI